jgi:iron complex outermembrane receptor protein
LYAFTQQYLGSELLLNGGIRYELSDTYGKEWIPQIGLVWNPGEGTTLKGSVSKGYRPPSIRELYLFPPANEDLRPERMVNIETGWMQNWMDRRMKTELNVFLARGHNLIVMVPPVAPPPPTYRNTGSFLNRGIEFSAQYDPSEQLRLHTNYTFIDMNTPLPATPVHNLFVSGSYRLDKFSLQVKLQNIFKLVNDMGDGTYSVIERSYHLLSAVAGYRVNRWLDVFIQANNLLNQQYQINNGYPMPGTSVFGGLNLRLEKD